jgi:hypothetical protein
VSDYDPLPEGETGPPESGPDLDVGTTVDDGQPTDQPIEEAPKNYLDTDEVADRYVRVTVDGQELEVPLKEALSGYSRQADYTRKTQELAQQRQQVEYALAVQRALQAQPAETIRLLSRQYGIQDQPPQSPPPPINGWEQPSTTDDGDDEFMDPLERRINQTQRMVEQLAQAEQQRDADRRLNAAIGGLQTKFQADNSTIREVVGTALQAGMGPESFEMIYKNIAYDREQQARAAAMATRQAQEGQREAAKVSSQQLVGNGPSANGAGGAQPGTSNGTLSISEAYEAALRELGVG